jgi:hypothetical protein
MATAVTDIAVRLKSEILGPESPFEVERIALRQEYHQILAGAAKVVVTDHTTKSIAVEHGRLLQAASIKSTEFFKRYKKQIDEVKDVVLAAEKSDVGAITSEKSRLANSISKFDAEELARKREQERKDREEAERLLREEQIQRAIELEQSGNNQEAERVLEEEPMPLPVIQQRSTAAPVSGFVGRTTWKGRLIGSNDPDIDTAERKARQSLFALVKAIANGQAPLELIKLDESFLNKQAASFRQGLNYVGCEAYEVKSSNFRA